MRFKVPGHPASARIG